MRLIGVKRSDKPDKKFVATFIEGGKEKKVYFGASGYSDFTIHKDEERKKRYASRHAKSENWNDPTTPGSLSKNLLWNKPTLKESIADFRKRFGL